MADVASVSESQCHIFHEEPLMFKLLKHSNLLFWHRNVLGCEELLDGRHGDLGNWTLIHPDGKRNQPKTITNPFTQEIYPQHSENLEV